MSRVEGKRSMHRIADIRRGALGIFDYRLADAPRDPCFWCGTRADIGCEHSLDKPDQLMNKRGGNRDGGADAPLVSSNGDPVQGVAVTISGEDM